MFRGQVWGMRMSAWIRVSAAIGMAAMIGACAQVPTAPKIKAFADATGSTLNVYNQSIDLNRELAQRYGDERAARAYLISASDSDCQEFRDKASVLIRDKEYKKLVDLKPKTTCGYNLPTDPGSGISPENRKVRTALIKAIAGYAAALGEASDNGEIEKLEAAAVTLGTVASTAFNPLLGSAAAPIISPASKAIARGLGLAMGNAYAVEVREIMARADAPLKESVRLLKRSLDAIKHDNEAKLSGWIGMKKTNLSFITDWPNKNFNSATKGEAYNQIRAAASEARALQDKIDALQNYGEVLDALLKAHAELLEPDEQGGAALGRFIKLSDDLTAVAATLQK